MANEKSVERNTCNHIVEMMFRLDGEENLVLDRMDLVDDEELFQKMSDYVHVLHGAKNKLRRVIVQFDDVPRDFVVECGDFTNTEIRNTEPWSLYAAWRAVQKLDGMSDDYRWVESIEPIEQEEQDGKHV